MPHPSCCCYGQTMYLATRLWLPLATVLVVAHTTRGHIDSACRGRVWRIDTGVGYADGNIELLNIVGDEITTMSR